MMKKYPFEIGDLVTGVDRSYKRSIYKFIDGTENPEMGRFEFQSLRDSVVDMFKDRKSPSSQYTFPRSYSEFRPASSQEISISLEKRARYKLFRLLVKLSLAETYLISPF